LKEGEYKVYSWWAKDAKAATHEPGIIDYSGVSKSIKIHQQKKGDGWVLL